MIKGEITFDRFIRGILMVLFAVGVYLLLDVLSGVLWQFFLAWLLAYMLYPLVRFLEKRCYIRIRAVSILLSLLLVLGALVGVLYIAIPPTINQLHLLTDDLIMYVTEWAGKTQITDQVLEYIMRNYNEEKVMALLHNDSTWDTLGYLGQQLWVFLSETLNVLMGLLNVFVVFLYLFFILLDYETISQGWVKFIPADRREMTQNVFHDLKTGMNAYFRGQGLIVLLVGILFSIGFLIIDFPLAIGLGLFIGLLNFVPYLQLLGFLPVTVLALLKASDTGESFWGIMAMAVAVFCVVQVLQDMVLTPKIMGKAMGLNPAIILLSLSVWGCLLGFIGLVIALPLTTICISYYKRFVVEE